MKLLLISNSTNAGEAYLEYPKTEIDRFLKAAAVKRVLFVPYAAVTFSFDAYLEKVRNRFGELGIAVDSVHLQADPVRAVQEAEAVVVGGGNTFHLVRKMQENGLMEPIRCRVTAGMPYVGWSAGSNVACPTLCTTNDMPIVQPLSFETLSLIPFQINPHYLDAHPDGHAGETREQRIEEFIAANREVTVAGLREGCMLEVSDGTIRLIGSRPMRVFRYGKAPQEYRAGDDIGFLLQRP